MDDGDHHGRDDGRPVGPREVLSCSRGLVEPALRSAAGTLPDSMLRIAGDHLGWWDEYGDPVRESGGTAIRSALVLCSSQAVELVHNHSLLHDDVMDGDTERRHRRTAWSVFGVNPAILAGYALLALALDVLAASGHPAATGATRMLTAAVQDLLNGQCAEPALSNARRSSWRRRPGRAGSAGDPP